MTFEQEMKTINTAMSSKANTTFFFVIGGFIVSK